jgi:hypothetical protein
VEETEDGTVLWLRRPTADAVDRLCIDSMTGSAMVFWATMPWKINSKTFRAASALQDWLMVAGKQPVLMSNREALLRLATDKNDGPAMTCLGEKNAEVFRAAVARYFDVGPAAEQAKTAILQRVAERARSYETEQDADQWVAQCVNAECDRLRNEGIPQKANKD